MSLVIRYTKTRGLHDNKQALNNAPGHHHILALQMAVQKGYSSHGCSVQLPVRLAVPQHLSLMMKWSKLWERIDESVKRNGQALWMLLRCFKYPYWFHYCCHQHDGRVSISHRNSWNTTNDLPQNRAQKIIGFASSPVNPEFYRSLENMVKSKYNADAMIPGSADKYNRQKLRLPKTGGIGKPACKAPVQRSAEQIRSPKDQCISVHGMSGPEDDIIGRIPIKLLGPMLDSERKYSKSPYLTVSNSWNQRKRWNRYKNGRNHPHFC